MNCERFTRWLDDGCPERDATQARRHARDCAHCATACEAALELDAAMAATPAAPRGFTDRVMARVAETPQVAAREIFATVPRFASVLSPALPWWVRAAREPAIVLAAALIAVLAAWGDDLVRGATASMRLLSGAMSGAAAPGEWTTLIEDPRVAVAVAIALTPSLVWASRRLYALGNKLAG